MRTSTSTATIGLLAAALGIAGCGGRSGPDRAGGTVKGKPVVLTMANGNGDSHELDPFAASVRRLSGGSVRIAFRNDWRHGSTAYETGLIRDVAAGKADLGWAGARAFDSVGVQSFDPLVAPLLIDSYALERRVAEDRALMAQMLRGLARAKVVGLGVVPGPMRKPLGVRPLAGPEDYRGATIALNRSHVGSVALHALGAHPVEIARGGPIEGVDGVEQQIGSIDANLYDKVATYLTANVNLWPRPLVLFANSAALARLTDDQRQALRAAARAAVPAAIGVNRVDDQHAAENICRRGRTFVTATPADLAALRRAVQPVYDRLEADARAKSAIARITAMRRELAARPEAVVCHRPAPARLGRKTPIDGVWRMTSGAHDTPEVASPSNFGHWTFVFDRGQFAITQQSPHACTWGYGTYTVTGSRTAWTFTDGGGRAIDNAYNKPGEHFVFGWSRFRDRLRVTGDNGEVSPENFFVHPWRRVSSTPARRYLNPDCPPPAGALPHTR